MSQPEILDVFVLVELTKAFASRGDIDPVSNLAGHKAFLYSGTQDTVVHPGVVHKLQEYYQTLGVNVTTEFDIASEHTQPTINYGNRCEELAVHGASCGGGGGECSLFCAVALPVQVVRRLDRCWCHITHREHSNYDGGASKAVFFSVSFSILRSWQRSADHPQWSEEQHYPCGGQSPQD